MCNNYQEFRFRLIPVRCTMGGGPGGCHRVLSKYQDKIDTMIDSDSSWEDIWRETGISRHCCQQSVRGFSWHYEHNGFSDDYGRNSMIADNGVWSTSFGDKSSYPIHTRCYRNTDFVGYGSKCFKTVQEADLDSGDVPDITLDSNASDDEMLSQKHLQAISMLIDDRIIRPR